MFNLIASIFVGTIIIVGIGITGACIALKVIETYEKEEKK